MIRGINESKTLTVNVNFMEESVIQINGGTTINIEVNECKKLHVCEKNYGLNSATATCS